MRGLLLAGSQSAWLRRQATRRSFVRRAVSRFMPGESLEDAIRAAAQLKSRGMASILTHLGENVTSRAEADEVARHVGGMLDRLDEAGLDAEVAIKLTQLGLDVSPDLALEHTAALAARAARRPGRFWIDMEGSAYTEATLAAYRQLRPTHPRLGVAMQAYLRRTSADLETLLPLAPAIRLVKGAYSEPATIAFASKREVDESFFALARRLLSPEARASGAWTTIATHDARLIARVRLHAEATGCLRDDYEFAMLYGIARAEQERLAFAGARLKILISYGSFWFPWYMRRLAERPANVAFVLRSLVAG